MAKRPPPAARETFAQPADVLEQIVTLQQKERAQRLAPVYLLLAYAEWTPHPPEEARADVKALCDEVYRRLYPPRTPGGRPPDLTETQFREEYWTAYQKVRLDNLRRGMPRVQKPQVAAQLLLSIRTFSRYRTKYKLPWPPPPP